MLNHRQVGAGYAMLALLVNGEDLTPDHGYPARVVAPAIPGLHAPKWVASISHQHHPRAARHVVLTGSQVLRSWVTSTGPSRACAVRS